MNPKKVFFEFFIFCLVLFFVIVSPVNAAAPVVAMPFGGKIAAVIPCLFSGGNFLIKQIPAAGSPVLILRPGISKLYAYYQPLPGSYILGNTLGADICIVSILPPIIVPAPLISMIGTSGIAGTVSDFMGGGGSDSDSSGNDSNMPPNNPTSESSCQNQPTDPNNPCDINSNRQAASYIIANEGWIDGTYVNSAGQTTFGVGHYIQPGQSAPSGSVASVFENDFENHCKQVTASAARRGINIWSADFDPDRRAVLLDMGFNMGSSGGGGLDGFNRMWDAIGKNDWSRAGAEILDSGYNNAGLVGTRSGRNASTMESGSGDLINQRINGDSQANNFCSGSV